MKILSETILYKFDAPRTAFKYIQELLNTIQSLRTCAHVYQPSNNTFLQLKYGLFVRRVNYKKMAVIYTIHDKVVFIHRIIPQSIINDL